jgi:hypothetical protein
VGFLLPTLRTGEPLPGGALTAHQCELPRAQEHGCVSLVNAFFRRLLCLCWPDLQLPTFSSGSLGTSVPNPSHFGTDPYEDPDPRIRTSD